MRLDKTFCQFFSAAVLLNCIAPAAICAQEHALGERITVPPSNQLSPEQRQRQIEVEATSASGTTVPAGVTGPRGILLLAPKLFDGWSAMVSGMHDMSFDPRLRELAILVVARAFDSPYEWGAHEQLAIRRGISPAVVEAIRVGDTPSFTDATEQAVYDYTHELLTTHNASDTTYKQAWDLLGTQGLLELTVMIGHYVNVALTANAHQMQLPNGAASTLPLPAR